MNLWKVVVILVIGYFIGAYFGSFGKSAISKVQSATGLQMNQSGVIAFFLIAGFIIFVTIKGELPAYAKTVGLQESAIPFAFIIVGIVLTISGVKGTSQDLLKLVKGDLQGKNGYLYWLVAILTIGAVGYIPGLKSLSHAFLILVLVVLVLKEGNPSGQGGGFFSQFTQALSKISQPINTTSSGGSLASS